MPRRCTGIAPPDEAILRYENVPIPIAAKYIGASENTIRWALQEERATFGFAVQNPETGYWTYNISPGLLVGYKRGTSPIYKLKEVISLAAKGVEDVLDLRLSSAQKAINKIIGGTTP